MRFLLNVWCCHFFFSKFKYPNTWIPNDTNLQNDDNLNWWICWNVKMFALIKFQTVKWHLKIVDWLHLIGKRIKNHIWHIDEGNSDKSHSIWLTKSFGREFFDKSHGTVGLDQGYVKHLPNSCQFLFAMKVSLQFWAILSRLDRNENHPTGLNNVHTFCSDDMNEIYPISDKIFKAITVRSHGYGIGESWQ